MGKKQIREAIMSIAVLCLGCIMAVSGCKVMWGDVKSEEKIQLEVALRQAIVECYAIEGAYPANITYLEEHYGLVVDKESFQVKYKGLGDHIVPDYKVTYLHRGKKNAGNQ